MHEYKVDKLRYTLKRVLSDALSGAGFFDTEGMEDIIGPIIGGVVLIVVLIVLASPLVLGAFGLFSCITSAFRETGWVLNRAIKTGTLRVFICRILGGSVAALSAALLVLAVMPEFFGLDPHHFTILEDIDGFWVLCLPFLVGGILVLCLTSHRHRGRRSHSWRDI